jgi:hypothetical protein
MIPLRIEPLSLGKPPQATIFARVDQNAKRPSTVLAIQLGRECRQKYDRNEGDAKLGRQGVHATIYTAFDS